MKKPLTSYNARWYVGGETTARGNVSFFARDDAAAITKARQIAREINLPNTTFQLYSQSRHIHTGL